MSLMGSINEGFDLKYNHTMALKITCIKKDNGNHENPYMAISSLQWINELTKEHGTSTRVEMYDFVNKGGEAYVMDASGNRAKLEARLSERLNKYVKTKADDVKSDNLLKLPECR